MANEFPPHPEDLLTPEQVGELMHHSARLVLQFCREGGLRHVQEGRKILIKRKWLWQWAEEHATGDAATHPAAMMRF
jgi:excisionase family DNA binding protein